MIKFPIEGYGSLNLLDITLLFSIISGTLLIFQKRNWEDFREYLLSNSLFNGTGLFLLAGLIALFVNWDINWIKSLSVFKSFFVLPILFTIIVKFFIEKKKVKPQSFFHCYLGYSLVLSLLAIFYKLFQITTFDNRVRLFFDSPNQLAISLSLGILSSLIFWNPFKNKKFLFPTLILAIGLLLTKSVGAILATLLVTVLIYSPQKTLKTKQVFQVFLVLSFSLVLLILFLTPALEKLNYNPFLNKNSLDSRLVIHLSTTKIISDNFLSGIGFANFQKKYLAKQTQFPPYPQWAVPHSHNLFTQIWVSCGIFGLIFWVFLLFKKTLSEKKLFWKVSVYFILYFLIHGLVDVSIWNNDQALFFWFIFLL
ncbi:MAG: O-antigen ligase family protein [Candidatus Moranbacteria bacterium]|nr:O-antigen ligase family protein [Candidatus Moranbacteria bacterium]